MSRPIVGLDPSLTGCGLATPDGEWTLTSKPAVTVTARAARLVSLADAVAARCPEGSLIVMEGPAFSKQLGAGHHLAAGLWWVLAVELTHRGHDVVEMAPTCLKKWATGKGNATKPDMRMALFQRTARDVRSDDEVDALWLRYAGLTRAGDARLAPSMPAPNRDALDAVQWPGSRRTQS